MSTIINLSKRVQAGVQPQCIERGSQKKFDTPLSQLDNFDKFNRPIQEEIDAHKDVKFISGFSDPILSKLQTLPDATWSKTKIEYDLIKYTKMQNNVFQLVEVDPKHMDYIRYHISTPGIQQDYSKGLNKILGEEEYLQTFITTTNSPKISTIANEVFEKNQNGFRQKTFSQLISLKGEKYNSKISSSSDLSISHFPGCPEAHGDITLRKGVEQVDSKSGSLMKNIKLKSVYKYPNYDAKPILTYSKKETADKS